MGMKFFGAVLAAALLSLGPAYAADDLGDVQKLNSSIRVEDNGRAEDLKSVNGSIHIGNSAEVKTAKTVNGSVELGDDGRAGELETVNGQVSIGARGVVSGDAGTVNGKVVVGDSASVRGTVRSVNGELRLMPRAQVGRLNTVLGDITLQDNSQVAGDIRMERPKNWGEPSSNWPSRKPKVTIGAGAQVHGEMVFEHPVTLRVHSTARIGKVTGAEVERFQ